MKSLAVLSRLDFSRKPLIIGHLCHDPLCTLCCAFSLCSSSRWCRILDNLESSHTSRFPHLHGCRLCMGRGLRLDCCESLAALAMDSRHRPLQWDTLLLVHHLAAIWLCGSLVRCGSDNTLHNADVHLVGSQSQSEVHSIHHCLTPVLTHNQGNLLPWESGTPYSFQLRETGP